MTLYERVGCVHIHTRYSDGNAEPPEIALLANAAGLDFAIVTDHNAYQPQHEGWYGRCLLLVGEELHNPANPQANHYLAFNAGVDLVDQVADVQTLIDAVRARGGLGYIAHPDEHTGEVAREPEINWVAWQATGYTGLELWNYMSEFKGCVTSPLIALLYAYWPRLAIRGPYPETVARWDALQSQGKVVVLGGVDAHAGTYSMGPIRRRVFSYEHLFRALTTHVLLPAPWSGDLRADAAMLYAALGEGKAFLAYDGLAPARGFAFFAQQGDETYTIGDDFLARGAVSFSLRAPGPAHLRLLLNGHVVAEGLGRELTHTARTPGAYRAEALRRYMGVWRTWVVTNAIHMRTQRRTALPERWGARGG